VKLERFLAESGMRDGQLAAQVGSDTSTINRLKGPKPLRTASLALALQIEIATRGKVSAEELPLSRKTRRVLTLIRASERGAA
jgi:hypothetical protein